MLLGNKALHYIWRFCTEKASPGLEKTFRNSALITIWIALRGLVSYCLLVVLQRFCLCLWSLVYTLEFCGLLASVIILPYKELPEKIFIITEAHVSHNFTLMNLKV